MVWISCQGLPWHVYEIRVKRNTVLYSKSARNVKKVNHIYFTFSFTGTILIASATLVDTKIIYDLQKPLTFFQYASVCYIIAIFSLHTLDLKQNLTKNHGDKS